MLRLQCGWGMMREDYVQFGRIGKDGRVEDWDGGENV